MKRAILIVLMMLIAGLVPVFAQTTPPKPPMPMGPPGPNWMVHIPQMLGGDWWNNPEVAKELQLTDPQKRQLQQVSMNLKLSLIDSGATGLKSYVHLQALLDADQLDSAAYNQRSTELATAASKLVKDLADTALSVRKTLTAEQWRKLEAMHKRGAGGMHMGMHEGMHGGMGMPMHDGMQHDMHDMHDMHPQGPPPADKPKP